ncbi:bifunctional hydroxymethylpyrimidine kinase/phosphomethylpyrimidine kinase [Belliella aquatica]|uniref:hydroxymethylpyrimidine kinase n=1 Tax=Belliella aquatica TaxID=1323734 RepID=A0ABQ1MY92_9BACT|nr:bifunctional hydroxymethylpyrimidine kinase/phosphomethylpyrimidine kinase [Belliella aquatica]MCH7406723.1 bifunctional hydroxymethylpyrimidine kinase/phosphomethylpyrimidine kinase [Belliella aquatica]GGC49024.1 hydroxymethylpyrimidine/phosphomethylpyrimidine kinase [Belliella aquatica]
MKTYIPVLSIAGSDSSGGAGIQADLKTFSALGCYGMTVITATTAQNTQGVRDIHSIPVSHIAAQLDAILEDIMPKAIKIGMIDRPEVVDCLVEKLKGLAIPIVFDPVMVATSGDRLIREETIEVIKEKLFPITTLLTPNLDETEILCGFEIHTLEEMKKAAAYLQKFIPNAVLIKGGHLQTEMIQDLLVFSDGKERVFESEKIQSSNVHGTGCSLSAAIAAELAKGHELEEAVTKARNYIYQAILNGKTVKTGKGNGPLNHFYDPQKQIINEME